MTGGPELDYAPTGGNVSLARDVTCTGLSGFTRDLAVDATRFILFAWGFV